MAVWRIVAERREPRERRRREPKDRGREGLPSREEGPPEAGTSPGGGLDIHA